VVSVGSDQIKIEGVTRVEDGARDYLDLAATYNFADMGAFSNLSARLGINNVTDKDPPLLGANSCIGTYCNGNTYPQGVRHAGAVHLHGTYGRFLGDCRAEARPTGQHLTAGSGPPFFCSLCNIGRLT
jgi:outer membrane receptor protein involved in Fe transport